MNGKGRHADKEGEGQNLPARRDGKIQPQGFAAAKGRQYNEDEYSRHGVPEPVPIV